MFDSIKKEIMKELSNKVLEKKPNDDNELKELVEDVVKLKMKK
jgi:hypothetical protein